MNRRGTVIPCRLRVAEKDNCPVAECAWTALLSTGLSLGYQAINCLKARRLNAVQIAELL